MVIFGAVLLLVLGYLAGASYLNSNSFQQIILKQVHAVMDGRLDVVDHRIALLSSRLTLSGITLADVKGRPLVSADQVDLQLFWPALIWRQIRLTSLSLDKVTLHLRFDQQDQLQFVTFNPAKSDESSQNQKNRWSLRIDNGQLTHGALNLSHPTKGWTAKVEGVNVLTGVDSPQRSGQIHITTGPLYWQHGETIRNMAAMTLTASLDSGQSINLELDVPDAKLAVSGRPAGSLTDRAMDLAVRADADLAAIQSWLPEIAFLDGRISAQISAKGPMDDPTVTMDAHLTQGEVFDVPVDQLTADLHLHEHRLAIKRVHSQSDWGALIIDGTVDLPSDAFGRLIHDISQWDALRYDLKLKASDLQPDRLPLSKDLPKGTYQITTQVAGGGLPGPQAHGSADIDINAATLILRPDAKAANGHLSAKFQWQGAEMELSTLDAALGSSRLQAHAQLDHWSGPVKEAVAQFQTDNIEELGAQLGIQLPSGAGEVKLWCHGPFRSPTARLDLLARKLTFNEKPLGNFLAETRLGEDGKLSIPRIVLENQGSLIQGSGSMVMRQTDGRWLSDPDVDLNVIFQQLSPADFGWFSSMTGHLNGRALIQGSPANPSGEMVLEKSPVAVGGFEGYVKGSAQWADDRLQIQALNLFKGASTIHSKGSITWRQTDRRKEAAKAQIQAEIEGQEVLLQDFFKDHHGTFTLKGTASGPVSDLEGRFQVLGKEWTLQKQPLQHVALSGRLEGSKLICDDLRIDVQKDQTLKATGWYGFDRQFLLNIDAQDIELSHMAALQQIYPIKGRLNLQAKASGMADNPQMQAELKVIQPRLKDQRFDDFVLNADMSEHQLRLAADLNFKLGATVQLDQGDFDLQARFDRTELDPYLAFWAGKAWGGFLSGRLQASGNWRRMAQVQAELMLNDAELRYRQQPVVAAPRLQASLKNQYVKMPDSRLVLLKDSAMNISAKGHLLEDLQVMADGRLPVAALAPFVEALENPQGDLLLNVRSRGPVDKLQWYVDLDLNQVGVDIPGLGQPLNGLIGRLRLTPDDFTVQDLSGRMDEGRFNLDGKLQIQDGQPTKGQLKLKAYRLPLHWPGKMDVVLNGDLTLDGHATRPRLVGELVLLEGTYYKDVRLNLLSAITQPKRALTAPSTISLPPQIGKIALNVDVAHRSPFLVDNNLANLEVAPDLNLSGTLARPILNGRAEVTAGQIAFRGKTFTIQRGVVDFINPYKNEPILDISAQADIRQWQVSLSISGTPDQLRVNLNSDPEVPEADILSLILLGRTGSELSQGEGGQTTQQMLASLVDMAWGEEIRKRSGLDILEVETGSHDAAQSADRTQLTLGKRLSRRLIVKYELESGGDEVVRRAVSEYRFLEHLLASGFQNSKGEYGSELLFRIEF